MLRTFVGAQGFAPLQRRWSFECQKWLESWLTYGFIRIEGL
jgi:hypothetical protein